MSVAEAKEVLRQNGYFTDNLWSINDVQSNWKCDEDTAQEVLYKALTNNWIVEQIFSAIGNVADDMEIERLEDTD